MAGIVLELYLPKKYRMVVLYCYCIVRILITDYCIDLKKPVLVNPGVHQQY